MKRRTVGLILPEHQQNNRRSYARILGYIFRAALALLCTYGMLRLACDSLKLEIGHGFSFAVCAAVCTVFAVMLTDMRLLCGGVVVLGAAVTGFIGMHGGFIKPLYLAGASVYNAWNHRLVELGYVGASADIIDLKKDLTALGLAESDAVMLAFVLAVLLLGMICSFSIIRRARLMPLLAMGTVLATLMFYFGACEDSFGISLMLAALCGVVTLCLYDNIYCRRANISAALGTIRESSDSRRELDYTLRVNSSLGGWAGITSALIALAIMVVPMNVTAPMEDVPEISHPAAKVENFIVALARGENPDPTGLIFGGSTSRDKRDTAADKRVFTGQRMFEVQSDVRLPIYLRSWVGTDYKYDSWQTVSYDRLTAYHETFGSGFSHEFLTSELLRAIDPALVALPNGNNFADYSELGYVTAHVHIDKKAPTTSLVHLPSYTDQRVRFLAYGSHDEPLASGYSNFFDGIFTSAEYVFVDDYTVLAQLPVTPSEDIARNISALIQYYSEQYNYLQNLRVLLSYGTDDAGLREAYDRLDNGNADSPLISLTGDYSFPSGEDSLAYRYAYKMTPGERREVDALMDNLALYYEFVYDNYLTGCENFSEFQTLVGMICVDNGISMRRSAQSYTGRHEIVMAVIDYLSENTVYTLTPKAPDPLREYVNSADTFLFDTKEGYCVQYATSAVMLLRAAGIPARYAEGYIVHDFSDAGDIARYKSTVRDSNAHAWIEVYYDYYGWVQYEATTPYTVLDEYDEPAAPDETDNAETTAPDTVDTRETAPADTSAADTSLSADVTTAPAKKEPDDLTASLPGTAIAVTAAAVTIAALAAAVIIIINRAAQNDKKRREAVRRARDSEIDAAERIAAARLMSDEIMHLLCRHGLAPSAGETASRFAERVDTVLEIFGEYTFSEVIGAMQSCEFSDGVTNAELGKIASCYSTLYDLALERAGIIARLRIKLVGH